MKENHGQPLKVYALKTVTYGLASSTFLATMTLQQLAEDGRVRYPLAAAAMKKSFYIDDMLAGADTVAVNSCVVERGRLRRLQGVFEFSGVIANST